MKTIGLLGGMSWVSTVEYYRVINETVRDRLGGLHSARIALLSAAAASSSFFGGGRPDWPSRWGRSGKVSRSNVHHRRLSTYPYPISPKGELHEYP